MEELRLIKKAFLKHEVQRLLDIARYEELNDYLKHYDNTGRYGKERLEELRKRTGMTRKAG